MSARVAALLTVSATALTVIGTARADGLPVLGVDAGPTGVTTPAGSARYVTIPAGRKTVVAGVRRDGGRIMRSRLLAGTFTIPAVAYDGSASGLSADGHTLVLITPRTSFPRARTTLLVLLAPQLTPSETIRLRGDFSFDAISPQGHLIYLIQYTNPRDPTRYAVRAYDLVHGRLLPASVVDPRESDEKMRGNPISRALSPDGRWAYTLYDGGGTPFVHALDTSRRTARCIDLDALNGSQYLWRLRLRASRDGDLLAIRDGKEVELLVSTRTFEPRRPSAANAASATGSAGSGLGWPLAALAAIGALAAAGALIAFGRRRHLWARTS